MPHDVFVHFYEVLVVYRDIGLLKETRWGCNLQRPSVSGIRLIFVRLTSRSGAALDVAIRLLEDCQLSINHALYVVILSRNLSVMAIQCTIAATLDIGIILQDGTY